MLLEPHQEFVKAKQILYETYGKRNVIARSYIANLLEGPSVKKNDSEALIELARKVEECYTTLGHLNYFSDLNCFENISKIVRRLPFDLQSRWLRISAGVEREGREPDFADLKRFIVNEADVVKSSYANSLNFKSKPGSVFGVNTHYTVASNSTKAINTYECKFCRSLKHVLWKCPEFSEISVKERLRFMHQRHLCYNCGKAGHISKYCYSEAACTKNGCKQKHHLLLHQERRDVSPSKDKPCPSSIEQARNLPTNTKPHSTNFLAASNITVGSNVFLNVVPVYVETGSKSVLTCAFLDQGSTTSLCANRLLNLLDISGEPTKFSVTTVTDCSTLRKGEKVNLTVRSLTGDEINLQNVLSVDQLPVVPNLALTRHEFEAWPHLQDLDLPAAHGEVLLLIGLDTPEAFWVKEERRGSAKKPYAVRGVLGWSVVGPRTTAQGNLSEGDDSISVNFLNTSDHLLDSQIQCLWRLDDVPKCNDNVTSMSREDRYALQQMQQTKNVVRGHYQVGLPWRPGTPCLPDNYSQARTRLSRLKGRLLKDPALKEKYSNVITSYLSQGHCQLVKPEESACEGWYLPHHAVLHPHKPEKVRVVFDCAAKYAGYSLNDQLLSGPDFLNNLIGVLTRFRFEKIAVAGDIEQMFHQVFVDPKDRNYLRFLWWPEGDLTKQPEVYHMNVHLFGATSSPSCAQFSLLQSAEDQQDEFDKDVRSLIVNNFYMDDCLFTAPTVQQAIYLRTQVSSLLKNRGFRLTKFLSNNKDLLQSIPEEDRAKSKTTENDGILSSSCRRILGVLWDNEEDSFKFHVKLKDGPFTRRGLLYALSSVFDPLGFLAPLILAAKLLLQDLCRRKYDWDDRLSEEDVKVWKRWSEGLRNLSAVSVPRCLIRSDMGEFDTLFQTQLHHFADASSVAYSTVSYLRVIASNGTIFCNFLMGKSRLAPLKTVSIPRLELVAATMATKVDVLLRNNFGSSLSESVFWTDSMTVLYMIRNSAKRFPVFVSNRLAQIEDRSTSSQWRFVPSSENPADDGTRPSCSVNRWLTGPSFLQEPESLWPQPPHSLPDLPAEFKIVKRMVAGTEVAVSDGDMEERFARFLSFYRLKRTVARIL